MNHLLAEGCSLLAADRQPRIFGGRALHVEFGHDKCPDLVMAHVMERAATGRSQCRACGARIARDELRFGERRDNSFGEGESTMWFHPLCAAYMRPEQLLELLSTQTLENTGDLRTIAESSIEHPRLPRLKSAERSPSGRANCRHCRRPIDQDTWRLALLFFEEFRFDARGFIHAACTGEYCGTTDVVGRIRHFNPQMPASDVEDLCRVIAAGRA